MAAKEVERLRRASTKALVSELCDAVQRYDAICDAAEIGHMASSDARAFAVADIQSASAALAVLWEGPR